MVSYSQSLVANQEQYQEPVLFCGEGFWDTPPPDQPFEGRYATLSSGDFYLAASLSGNSPTLCVGLLQACMHHPPCTCMCVFRSLYYSTFST